MKSSSLLIAAVAVALATTAQAQVKVGSNPGTLSTNAVLDVEGTSGSHTVVLQNGNTGIGTAAPVYPFQTVTNTNNDYIGTFDRYTSGGGWSVIGLRKGYGTAAAPAAVSAAGQNVGQINFQPYNGSSFNPGASILAVTAQAQTTAAGGTNLSFFTTPNNSVAAAERMRISEAGYVGIGRTDPDRRLTIQDNGSVSIYVASTGADMDGMIILNAANRPTSSSIDQFLFFQQSNTNVGSIVSNGAGGVTYQTTSDKRLKENIAATHFGIKDLMKIGVKDYTMKGIPGKVRTGFLAQDLHTVYPEAVAVGGEDASKNPWTVDYGRITPLLVKSIQDQQVQIEALKKENATLKSFAASAKASQNAYAQLSKQVKDMQTLLGINTRAIGAQKSTSVTKR